MTISVWKLNAYTYVGYDFVIVYFCLYLKLLCNYVYKSNLMYVEHQKRKANC